MGQARKIMELNTETTQLSRENAKIFDSIPTITFEDAVATYKKELAQWCHDFKVSSIQELVMKADTSELPLDISDKIFMYSSFLERHSKKI